MQNPNYVSSENSPRDNKERLVAALSQAFLGLKAQIFARDVNEIAELVLQSMSSSHRFYHSADHIFEVSHGLDEISLLAAAFHDVVYFQVDQGVGLNVARHVAPFIQEKNGQLTIIQDGDSGLSPIFKITLAIFGFQPGQPLSIEVGQNEFISALLAASVLEKWLAPPVLAQISACIEATIPFRGLSARGRSPAQMLLGRMEQLNQDMGWRISKEELKNSVRRAVRLANRDLHNFAESDCARFIDDTWDLLPEVNPSVRVGSHFSVRGYRQALQKMELFFRELYPEVVFQRFEGEPSEEAFDSLVQNAARNINVARRYFKIRLVGLGVLEGLSESLGENVPLTNLMGELPGGSLPGERLENFLPAPGPAKNVQDPVEREVRHILEKGRDKDTAFGIRRARYTEFLLNQMGFQAILDHFEICERFFAGELSNADLLRSFPKPILQLSSEAIGKLMQSRASRVKGLVESV